MTAAIDLKPKTGMNQRKSSMEGGRPGSSGKRLYSWDCNVSENDTILRVEPLELTESWP